MTREMLDQKNYVTILSSDGSFRMSVPEGTEGSVKREYETSDGKKGVKNEIVMSAITGTIKGVEFKDASFGRLLHLTINDEQGDLTISVGTASNFATDVMKKLPSMDLSKTYRLAPYAFTNDKGKLVKGISITLAGDKTAKVKNFFYDEEAKKELHDFPVPKGDVAKYTKNKWKSYFGEVEDFLVEYTKTHLGASLSPAPEVSDDEIDADAEADALLI